MKGLVLAGEQTIEFRSDLRDPEIEQPGDVIVAVERAGICGSDLHQYLGREQVAPTTIPGHEFVGRIVETGSQVKKFERGQMVFSPFTTCCGGCFFCRDGLSSRCAQWKLFGYQTPDGTDDQGRGLQGAQAEYVRVPDAEATLLSLPDGISLEEALLLGDNFTTGYFAADLGNIRPDGITVVLGCGSVGLSAIAAARYLGAETVIAADGVAQRRERARQLGAEAVSPAEVLELVQAAAGKDGRGGADSVLEAVGLPAAQKLAFSLVRPGGVIAAVGVHTASTFAFSPQDAYDRNVTYRAGRCSVRSYLNDILPQVESGRLQIPTRQILTHQDVPLQQGAAAYRMFSERRADCVKVVLDPGASG